MVGRHTLRKCDNKINQVLFILHTQELLSEHKSLTSLKLSVTYQDEPCIRPPSCKTHGQLTLYKQDHNHKDKSNRDSVVRFESVPKK